MADTAPTHDQAYLAAQKLSQRFPSSPLAADYVGIKEKAFMNALREGRLTNKQRSKIVEAWSDLKREHTIGAAVGPWMDQALNRLKGEPTKGHVEASVDELRDEFKERFYDPLQRIKDRRYD